MSSGVLIRIFLKPEFNIKEDTEKSREYRKKVDSLPFNI